MPVRKDELLPCVIDTSYSETSNSMTVKEVETKTEHNSHLPRALKVLSLAITE